MRWKRQKLGATIQLGTNFYVKLLAQIKTSEIRSILFSFSDSHTSLRDGQQQV